MGVGLAASQLKRLPATKPRMARLCFFVPSVLPAGCIDVV
jgi:hypothetical protein